MVFKIPRIKNVGTVMLNFIFRNTKNLLVLFIQNSHRYLKMQTFKQYQIFNNIIYIFIHPQISLAQVQNLIQISNYRFSNFFKL